MPHRVLRIIMGDVVVASVSGPRELAVTLRDAWPGCYLIEESPRAGELLSSGYSRKCWGVAIRQADGSVHLEPAPVES